MGQCWLSMADSGCLPHEWFDLIRTGSGSNGSRVARRNTGVNETLMKIELDWLKFGGSQPILIRDGESGFMTYCVKTRELVELAGLDPSFSDRGVFTQALQATVLMRSLRVFEGCRYCASVALQIVLHFQDELNP